MRRTVSCPALLPRITPEHPHLEYVLESKGVELICSSLKYNVRTFRVPKTRKTAVGTNIMMPVQHFIHYEQELETYEMPVQYKATQLESEPRTQHMLYVPIELD